jgi:hypothetical protein
MIAHLTLLAAALVAAAAAALAVPTTTATELPAGHVLSAASQPATLPRDGGQRNCSACRSTRQAVAKSVRR